MKKLEALEIVWKMAGNQDQSSAMQSTGRTAVLQFVREFVSIGTEPKSLDIGHARTAKNSMMRGTLSPVV